MNITKLNRNWLDSMDLSNQLLIAGPCSAESEEQMLSTAKQLVETTSTNIFRAGVWKPRTRPGGFEGIGVEALSWLQTVKYETGLLVTTEVGNAQHVEDALKHDIDVLWIGARTTVNPFVTQEIAEALKGTNKIVLIKNPVNPDLSLWLGAVERFYATGTTQLGVIHRGFSTYNNMNYRNEPKWNIPIELKRLFPDLPLIIDPSHICGRRDTLFDVSQQALDLNYDGMMIETHIDPDHALSDAAQQITPAQLSKLLAKLQPKQHTSDDSEFIKTLSMYRKELDLIDNNLIEMLSDRLTLSTQIGQLKANNNVSILQSGRWSEILESMIQAGLNKGINPRFIEELFEAIHVESINVQHSIKLQNKSLVK